MNADLKLRLRLLQTMNLREETFLHLLLQVLGAEALIGLTFDKDLHVDIDIEPIENGEDDSAYMTGDGVNFRVVIDHRMPFGMIVDFLIHELAHVHSWERADDKEDHCDEFGKSYALLYRKYLTLYDKVWSST